MYYRPGEWKRIVISDKNEGVQHGLCVTAWDGTGRDQLLTASFSRIDRYKLQKDGRWTRAAGQDKSGLHWKRHDIDVGWIAVASCAVVDLNGDGKSDVVSIGSSTANLFWYENTD